ncbi:MAG TPA: hypothetical protein VFQ37_00910 [Mycobacterium sp.]|nr:hypothetical protein [Mycobacterium sp.]
MNRRIAAAAAALTTLLVTATPALAKPPPPKPPPDPHMPNVQTGYCPGGRGLKGRDAEFPLRRGLEVSAIYCDGVPYADGSHWRYVQFSTIPDLQGMDEELRSFYGLHCVIAPELLASSFAPPGGCDGAV